MSNRKWLEKNKNSKAKSAKSSNKSSSSSASRVTAKLDDLSRLEGKLSGQIEDRFSSLDGKFDRLFGLISSSKGTDMRETSEFRVDNSTSGACRPQKESTAISGGRPALISLDSNLDGFSDQDQDDGVSLQPGQRERREWACYLLLKMVIHQSNQNMTQTLSRDLRNIPILYRRKKGKKMDPWLTTCWEKCLVMMHKQTLLIPKVDCVWTKPKLESLICPGGVKLLIKFLHTKKVVNNLFLSVTVQKKFWRYLAWMTYRRDFWLKSMEEKLHSAVLNVFILSHINQ